jgi:hypothetical protein
LCEWTIFGESDSKKEVYVWAFCQFRDVGSTAGSVPAVIYLDDNGDITKVVIPRNGEDYAEDIRVLFPPDVQKEIFAFHLDASKTKNYMNLRRTEETLPLIVAPETPLP